MKYVSPKTAAITMIVSAALVLIGHAVLFELHPELGEAGFWMSILWICVAWIPLSVWHYGVTIKAASEVRNDSANLEDNLADLVGRPFYMLAGGTIAAIAMVVVAGLADSWFGQLTIWLCLFAIVMTGGIAIMVDKLFGETS